MPSTILVADVGDAYTCLALANDRGGKLQLQHLRTQKTPRGRLQSTLVDYLTELQAGQVLSWAVAVSGRVKRLAGRSFVTLPEACLTIDGADLISPAPVERPPLLINDLAAVAAALPLLSPDELRSVGPARVGAPGVQIVVGLNSV